MFKKIILLCVCNLLCFSSAFASPFLNKLKANQPQGRNAIQPLAPQNTAIPYPFFTGNWIGTCDNNATLVMNMQSSPMNITINGLFLPINNMANQGLNDSASALNSSTQLFWSDDRKTLHGTMVEVESNYGNTPLSTIIDQFSLSENAVEQVILEDSTKTFVGLQETDSTHTVCILSRN